MLLVASSGGHLEQVQQLSALNERYDVSLLTERTEYEMNPWEKRVYYVDQVNRTQIDLLIKMVKSWFQTKRILDEVRPDVVVSTGALAAVVPCLLAKRRGIKLIYIESFAKTDSPTMTGKFLYKRADVFVVQWESMLKCFPDAVYWGGVY